MKRTRTPQQERRLAFNRAFEAGKVAVKRRSRWQCERCHTARAVLFHHKLQGRTHPRCNEPDFLAHLCLLCHTEVHANPNDSHRDGWLIHDWDVPKDVA